MNPVARKPDFTEYKQRMHRLIQEIAKTEDSNANKPLGLSGETPANVHPKRSLLLIQPPEYSSTVWDPNLTSDIHILEHVQRRAARLVHRNYTKDV